jgi:hypothetical protein
MKKYYLLITTLLATTTITAQLKFGIHSGVAISNILYKNTFARVDADLKSHIGFTIGGTAAVRLHKGLYSETGLAYCGKGHTIDIPNIIDAGLRLHYRFNYLQLNQNFVFRYTPPSGIGYGFGAGLFAATALSGKYSGYESGILGVQYVSGNVAFGNENYEYKRIDLGLNLLSRFSYKRLQLTTQMGFSFTPLTSNKKNISVISTLGYEF